jgi:SecD/SecF fusion protein
MALVVVFGLVLGTQGGAPVAWAQAEPDAPAAPADPSTSTAAETGSDAAPATGPSVTASTDAAAAEPAASPLVAVRKLAIVLSVFIVPVLVGGWLAKRLKMPDYSGKFSLVLGTLLAAAVVVASGEIKLGPDLSGGITLIYELEDMAADEESAQASGAAATAGDSEEAAEEEDAQKGPSMSREELVEVLIKALAERVDPSGTKEVSIRKYGEGQIEIIIPRAGEQELEYIQRRISTAGALEFRITASPQFSRHKTIIDLAERLDPGSNIVELNGREVARWVPYDVGEFGPPDEDNGRIVKRKNVNVPQALVLTDDGLDVTGEYLRSASPGVDDTGRPQVNFAFNAQGAFRFAQLTGNHLPNPSGQRYNLGILLDKKLLSAPSIESRIRDQGRISGGNMSEDEVNFIVGILNAGSLPAALNKDPISREQISPTIGTQTVEKGKMAIAISLIAVVVFMLYYYRVAGVIACVALGANLLLILGCMVLIKGAFTLPGLAGLVLTVGMSVDANVLIFERIREELARGAALRMAIRNGFARATQTIIDANVTTLITAVVIYKIAPDNVKGFGVTLILGILMSMYTAIFMSRIIFDVAERMRSLKSLHMSRLIGDTSVNFIGKQSLATVFSLALIVVGIVGVASRGPDLLNIDFTGGSSVTMVLKDQYKKDYAEVKSVLQETALGSENLSLVERGDTSTRYTVTTINQDVEAVQDLIGEAFAGQLENYSLQIGPLTAVPGGRSPAGGQDASGDPAESGSPGTDRFAGGTTTTLSFGLSESQDGADGGVSYETLHQLLEDALAKTGKPGAAYRITSPDYNEGSARRLAKWEVTVALPQEDTQRALDELKSSIEGHPVFPLANKIGGRVAGRMTTDAIAAIMISLIGIIAYIWVRFQRVMYGLAAVIALIHDILITLGVVALSKWIAEGVPPLASFLMIDKFQISLPLVAAFLTIIGYSLNDTIVVFDRIREVKGKSPRLTADMINNSINQTLSRTLLTSLTTLLTVVVLYFMGGSGIHDFAFALVVGVTVGTYSSIFVASPILLWMSRRADAAQDAQGARAA